MKKLLLSIISLSLIAMVAIFAITSTYTAKNTLLMKTATAIAQEQHPDRPPFNCPDTGSVECWRSTGCTTYEEQGLDPETICEDPLIIWKP